MTAFEEHVAGEISMLRREIEETAVAQARLEEVRSQRRADPDEVMDASRDFRAKQDKMMSHVGRLVQQHVDHYVSSNAEEGPHPHDAIPHS